MSNLRKLLGCALAGGDLSDDPLVETALDRIGALAFSDSLGSKLWRLKWANDAGAYKPALYTLVRQVRRKHEPISVISKLCEVVLREWLDEQCQSCGGRGWILVEGTPKSECTKCEHTGLRRYSDQARMRAMGFEKRAYEKWEPRFASVHSRIGEADRQTWIDIATQLERITGKASTKLQLLAFRRKHGILLSDGTPAHNENIMQGEVPEALPAHN